MPISWLADILGIKQIIQFGSKSTEDIDLYFNPKYIVLTNDANPTTEILKGKANKIMLITELFAENDTREVQGGLRLTNTDDSKQIFGNLNIGPGAGLEADQLEGWSRPLIITESEKLLITDRTWVAGDTTSVFGRYFEVKI